MANGHRMHKEVTSLAPRIPAYTHLGKCLQVHTGCRQMLTHGYTYTQGQHLSKTHKHQHTGDPYEHKTNLMTHDHTLAQPGHHPNHSQNWYTQVQQTDRDRGLDSRDNETPSHPGTPFSSCIGVTKTGPRKDASSLRHRQGHCGQILVPDLGNPHFRSPSPCLPIEGAGGREVSGLRKSDPPEEPTQKPEPSVSLATRLAGEVGRGIDHDGAPCGQWVEMEGILLLFPIRGTRSRAEQCNLLGFTRQSPTRRGSCPSLEPRP